MPNKKVGITLVEFENLKKLYLDNWQHTWARGLWVHFYMLLPLKTGSTFYHKVPNYLLKMFLDLTGMIKVPKFAKICQILTIFQSL